MPLVPPPFRPETRHSSFGKEVYHSLMAFREDCLVTITSHSCGLVPGTILVLRHASCVYVNIYVYISTPSVNLAASVSVPSRLQACTGTPALTASLQCSWLLAMFNGSLKLPPLAEMQADVSEQARYVKRISRDSFESPPSRVSHNIARKLCVHLCTHSRP